MIRYAITGEEFHAMDAAGLAARANFVQVRAKSLDAGPLTSLCRSVVQATGPGMRVMVSGRADVALAAGAAGVHLTSLPGELTPAQVRSIFAAAVISVSCHTMEEVRRASAGGADLILFAPVFEKRVGAEIVQMGLGLGAFHEACVAAGPVPVLALGGVTEENTAACLDAGAAGVAGIRLFR